MSDDDSDDGHPGSRLAKVIARAGLASRRDAEGMIEALRVTVNGRTISTPAYNVVPGDAVAVDGTPLPTAEGARVWLYHKPAGLVTTERDEKDRETVFDALRERLGRVLSVGRLDLTSEGLLLLTNDGDLKRQMELPDTGWLRRYRVRVNGAPDEAALQPLRDGIVVEGERFQPMQVTLDRQQGANAWLTVGLREGRNREVRRAMETVGLYVNRLIRVSYGPFQLGNLAAGEVEEVKPRVLRDQLGTLWAGELAEGRREPEAPEAGRKPRTSGDRLVDHGRGKPRGAPTGGAKGADRTGER
ncbi:MAG: pseudouridine synthase, partial [Jannaschia sp.]